MTFTGAMAGRDMPKLILAETRNATDVTPDILLTNYKMLDQLLLRHADQTLWRQSATSLVANPPVQAPRYAAAIGSSRRHTSDMGDR